MNTLIGFGFVDTMRLFFIFLILLLSAIFFPIMICSVRDSINPRYKFIFALVISLIIGANFFSVLGSVALTLTATEIFLGFSIGIIMVVIVIIGYMIGDNGSGRFLSRNKNNEELHKRVRKWQ